MPIVHRTHRLYAIFRRPFRTSWALPYGPGHGFLRHVPSNAIRMPGYKFVPGVGYWATWDMPASASQTSTVASNERLTALDDCWRARRGSFGSLAMFTCFLK